MWFNENTTNNKMFCEKMVSYLSLILYVGAHFMQTNDFKRDYDWNAATSLIEVIYFYVKLSLIVLSLARSRPNLVEETLSIDAPYRVLLLMW